MESYRKILGRNVRAARKDLGLVSGGPGFRDRYRIRTYISGIEREVRNPSLDMRVKLAKTLKTTPAGLLQKQIALWWGARENRLFFRSDMENFGRSCIPISGFCRNRPEVGSPKKAAWGQFC